MRQWKYEKFILCCNTGSRSGAVIASCWAAMMYFGEAGYVESTRKIVSTTRYIAKE